MPFYNCRYPVAVIVLIEHKHCVRLRGGGKKHADKLIIVAVSDASPCAAQYGGAPPRQESCTFP